MQEDLCLIVADNCKELGVKLNREIQKIRNTNTNYLLPNELPRFQDGEGKGVLLDSARGKDVYIISDPHNYSITYQMYDFIHHMSPDEHFMDIKRIISAIMQHAKSITVVMPLWYQSRQHRRKHGVNESLDMAMNLRDLENMGVKGFVTFDMHDVNSAQNAVAVPFDNFYATNDMLKLYLKNEPLDSENTYVVSPDGGAVERAKFLAWILGGVNYGVFSKGRGDKVVDGMNSIDRHDYLGSSTYGKNVLVADDMLASGGSMLDVALELKEQGAAKVDFFTTFSLFTKGIEKFDRAHEEGLFNGFYTTTLSYIPQEYLDRPWLHAADCSVYLARILDALNMGHSLRELKKDNSARMLARVKKHSLPQDME